MRVPNLDISVFVMSRAWPTGRGRTSADVAGRWSGVVSLSRGADLWVDSQRSETADRGSVPYAVLRLCRRPMWNPGLPHRHGLGRPSSRPGRAVAGGGSSAIDRCPFLSTSGGSGSGGPAPRGESAATASSAGHMSSTPTARRVRPRGATGNPPQRRCDGIPRPGTPGCWRTRRSL